MLRRPPRSTRTDTLFPYTTRFRAKGAEQNFREPADTDEARRRRMSSTNRILTILKAALNAAYRNGKAPADDAWRRVRPFPKAETPKLRYLQEDEIRRLVNACDPAFRPMVQAALLTGARYAELAALERSEEHTYDIPSLMRISYAVCC